MRLECGDCFDLFPEIESGSIDLLLTDPPYGITACDWDVKPDIPRFFQEAWRVLKPNGTILIFGCEPFSTMLRGACLGKYKYDLYWIKSRRQGFVHAKNMPMKQIEIISVFSDGVINHKSLSNRRMTYNPQGIKSLGKQKTRFSYGNVLSPRPSVYKGRECERFANFPTNILRFSEKHNNRFHPSEKPVELLEWLVKTYSNEGETVLDPFMGSGSTGVACVNTGRDFIGFEKEQEFFEIAKTRIEQTQKQNESQLVLELK